MELCTICNTEFKNLGAHLRTKHSLSKEEYGKNVNLTEIKDTDIDNLSIPEVKPKVIEEEVKKNPNRPLSVFLKEVGMTEKEVLALIRTFKTGSSIPISQQLKNKEDIGDKDAYELSLEGKNNLETRNLYTAQSLVKNYGFKCTEVKSGGGTQAKTWVLVKI